MRIALERLDLDEENTVRWTTSGRISISVVHGLDRRIVRSLFSIQSDREELNYREEGGTDRGHPLRCTQVRPPVWPLQTLTPPSWCPTSSFRGFPSDIRRPTAPAAAPAHHMA